MTKLMEWLLAASIVFSVWIALITGTSNLSNVEWYYKWFPAILIITFGLYAVIVILYRVFTFNNCESAAVELKRQIEEATTDLKSKGIDFKRT